MLETQRQNVQNRDQLYTSYALHRRRGRDEDRADSDIVQPGRRQARADGNGRGAGIAGTPLATCAPTAIGCGARQPSLPIGSGPTPPPVAPATQSAVPTAPPTATGIVGSVPVATATATQVSTATPTPATVNTATPTPTTVNTATPTPTPVNTATPTATPIPAYIYGYVTKTSGNFDVACGNCDVLFIDGAGNRFGVTSTASATYGAYLPPGLYDLYSSCPSGLLPVEYPDFTVTLDPGDNTGDIYVATCP